MDAKQKERKRKKREKVRAEHLEKAKHQREQQALSEPLFAPNPIRSKVPDHNDRTGWEQKNALSKDNIITKAKEMFKGDKTVIAGLESRMGPDRPAPTRLHAAAAHFRVTGDECARCGCRPPLYFNGRR